MPTGCLFTFFGGLPDHKFCDLFLLSLNWWHSVGVTQLSNEWMEEYYILYYQRLSWNDYEIFVPLFIMLLKCFSNAWHIGSRQHLSATNTIPIFCEELEIRKIMWLNPVYLVTNCQNCCSTLGSVISLFYFLLLIAWPFKYRIHH